MTDKNKRINKKILDCHLCLSDLYYESCNFSEELSQENLDALTESLKNFLTSTSLLKGSIRTLLLDVTKDSEENIEIDVEPTENGYKV